MDSLTQIVLGAAVGEAVAGKTIGHKAALWGGILGTIPDLDVFVRSMYHPVEGALLHRGFSHSLIFAILVTPFFGWLLHRLYRRRYNFKLWMLFVFWTTVTHPILDMFTNYGTQFLWPMQWRISFNSVFVIDPLYTIPFLVALVVALFYKKENIWRLRWIWSGLIYSSLYLLWGVIVKLTILNQSDNYFAESGIKAHRTIVTPMPFTSFYWLMITEDRDSYFIGYKSLFRKFDSGEIEIIPKNRKEFNQLKWKGKDYSKEMKFFSNWYYAVDQKADTLCFYDLRFGVATKFTEGKVTDPLMGYGMIVDNGIVHKTFPLRSNRAFEQVNFGAYWNEIFKKDEH